MTHTPSRPVRKSTHREPRRWGWLGFWLIAGGAAFAIWQFSQGDDFQNAVSRVQEAVARGDFTAAQAELVRLHNRQPRNADILELLSDVEIRRGRPAEAIDWLARIPDAAGSPPGLRKYAAAQKASELGLARQQEELLLDLLHIDPQFAAARKLLVRLYLITLRHPELFQQLAALDAAGELGSDLEMTLLVSVGIQAEWEGEEHIQWLETCLRNDPQDAVVRAALAHHYRHRNRGDEARRLWNSQPASGPAAWRLSLVRAEEALDRGAFFEAHQLLAALPAAADADPRVWLAWGKLAGECRNWAAAEASFRNAAVLDPFDSAAAYGAARAAREAERDEAAQQQFQRAAQLQEIFLRSTEVLQTASTAAVDKVLQLGQLCEQAGELRLAFLLARFALDRDANDEPARLACERLKSAPAASTPLTARSIEHLTPVDRNLHWKGDDSVPAPGRSAAAPDLANGIRFEEIASQVGLDFAYFHGESEYRWLMETLGGGAAVLDFDGDGWPDLYFTQGCQLPIDGNRRAPTGRLFRNDRGKRFVDVSAGARVAHFGYGQGCVAADYDNDGFADLLLCNYGKTTLYQNLGDGTFREVTAESGLLDSGWSTSAAFGDFDRDGDLDLYVVHYVEADYETLKPCGTAGHYNACRPLDFPAAQDRIWENRGDGRFVDRTDLSGIVVPEGKGLGVIVADFDEDGWPDIFVGNDTTANFLFRNRGRAASDAEAAPFSFEDRGVTAGVAFDGEGRAQACMGIACGDVDGDLRPDLFVTNFFDETNTLYRNQGGLNFSDHTGRARLADSSRQKMGWGCQFLDADGDGWLDLFVANGHLHDTPQTPQFYCNRGEGRFQEISQAAGAAFSRPRMGRSAALLDWNDDSRPDLVSTSQTENVSLWENRSPVGNRVVLELVGTLSNRDAEGARVTLRYGDATRTFRVSAGGGYFAGNERTLRIGIGAAQTIDDLRIDWPNGARETKQGLSAGTRYRVIEGQGWQDRPRQDSLQEADP
jgi:uncharacterized protein HemY